MTLQSIEEELRGLAFLNRELVNHIYNRVASIDARIRRSVLVMQESGIPAEVGNVFRVTQYEDKMQPLFEKICYTISEEHIPAIRGWMEDMVNQYCYATGAAIDIGWYLTYPDPSQSANAVTSLTERNSNVNDYALQCVAICDFADFLVTETEHLNEMLNGYKNWRRRLLEVGVPEQICSHYDYMYAQPLEGAINYNLREALTEAYKYLVEIYDQIVASMNRIGLSVERVPRALTDAGYGGDASTGFTTTSINVTQSPIKNEKEDKAAQAREQNLREMEKYFGKPNPEIKHNIAKADMQNANPHYGETDEYGVEKDEYGINCATCALAYALRRCFGFDVTAKGNTEKVNNLNYWLSFNNNILEVVKKSDGSPVKASFLVDWMKGRQKTSLKPEDYEDFFEEVCDKEGVYLFTMTWWGGWDHHVTILERDETGLHRIEPQVYDENVSDAEGKRSINDLVKKLYAFPSIADCIFRWDKDIMLDVEEKSFYIPNEARMIMDSNGKEIPEPMELVQDDASYDDSKGKVHKMRFTDLFSMN